MYASTALVCSTVPRITSTILAMIMNATMPTNRTTHLT
jgi:hypothetical protein